MDIQNRLERIKHRKIEQKAENMTYYGYAKTIGLVRAIMKEKDKPMNLDQLANETGMSKTRMSQVLREMDQLHVAEKVFIKGSKKDTYTVEKDKYEIFITLLVENWKSLIDRNVKVIDRLIKDLNEILNDKHATNNEIDQAKKYLDDCLHKKQLFQWIGRLAYFLESNEVFNHVPIEG